MFLVISTEGALSGLGFSAESIQSSPSIRPPTYSFLTVQGSSGQFQTVPTQLNSTQLNSTHFKPRRSLNLVKPRRILRLDADKA